MSEAILDIKRIIMSALSDCEIDVKELSKVLASVGKDLEAGKIILILEGLEEEGLVYSKEDQYTATLLGVFSSMGLSDVCESIMKRDDLFSFFKTRIPAKIPKEHLLKFKFSNDFKIIGKPDYGDRMNYLLNEAISILPVARKEIIIAVDKFFRPGFLYLMGMVRHRPKVMGLFSEDDFGREISFIKMVLRVTKMDLRVTDINGQSLGAFIVDGKYCLFGFRTQKGVPGHDALLVTEDEECIQWVREYFDYAWETFGRKI